CQPRRPALPRCANTARPRASASISEASLPYLAAARAATHLTMANSRLMRCRTVPYGNSLPGRTHFAVREPEVHVTGRHTKVEKPQRTGGLLDHRAMSALAAGCFGQAVCRAGVKAEPGDLQLCDARRNILHGDSRHGWLRLPQRNAVHSGGFSIGIWHKES